MDKKDTKSNCMACSCPCEMHKEHTHEGEKKNEEKSVCMACSCPCDEHKEHTHQ